MLRLCFAFLLVCVLLFAFACVNSSPLPVGSAAPDPALLSQLEAQLQAQLATQGGRGVAGVDGMWIDCTWSHVMSETDIYWYYRNTGDYDQNSEVNVSDLVPIAVHFGVTSNDAEWAEAQIADGDGNGEVNFSDVTPIGVNFGAKVNGYKVQGFLADQQTWHDVGTVDFAEGRIEPGSPVLHFYYYLWPDNGIGESTFALFRAVTIGN